MRSNRHQFPFFKVFAPRLINTVLLLIACFSARAAPTIDDFLREPDIRDVELSPDGRHLAVVMNSAGRRFALVRSLENPEMPVVAAYSDDIIRPNYVYWGNDHRLLVAMDVPYKSEMARRDKEKKDDFDIDDYFAFSRMIATNVDMTDSVILMQEERGLRANFSLSRITNFLEEDEDQVLMAAYKSGRRALYRVNINNGGAELVTTGSYRTLRFLNDEDGNPLYRFDYLPVSQAIVIYEYDQNGDWKKIEKVYLNKDDEDAIDNVGLIGLFQNDLLYRKRNKDTGFYELVIHDSVTGEKSTLVSLPDQDIRGVVYDFRTDRIVGYTIEKDYIRSFFFDADMQSHYDAIAAQVGDNNFSLIGQSRDAGVSLVALWGPDNPLSYHLWNAKVRKLEFLAHAYGGLTDANLAVSSIATYKARDGQSIRTYNLLPRDYETGKRYPTIVLPHGGPQSRSRASYDDFAQFLATRGYIVVQPNFRGSVGYGQEFEEAGYRQWGGTMQDDLADAVEFMIDEGLTDPERVGIVGMSYGGYAALMGAIKTPNLYRCAISINGVTHLAKLVEYKMKKAVEKEDWGPLLFERIGNPKDDRDYLDLNSPALQADKIKIPVMLIAGSEDNVVPFSQSKLMRKALQKAGADYEFVKLDESGHDPLRYEEHARTTFEAIESFLDANLR